MSTASEVPWTKKILTGTNYPFWYKGKYDKKWTPLLKRFIAYFMALPEWSPCFRLDGSEWLDVVAVSDEDILSEGFAADYVFGISSLFENGDSLKYSTDMWNEMVGEKRKEELGFFDDNWRSGDPIHFRWEAGEGSVMTYLRHTSPAIDNSSKCKWKGKVIAQIPVALPYAVVGSSDYATMACSQHNQMKDDLIKQLRRTMREWPRCEFAASPPQIKTEGLTLKWSCSCSMRGVNE